MATKKKDRFSKVKAVKDAAREKVGPVPATQVLPDTKSRLAHRQAKHKKKMEQVLEEESQ